MSRPNVHEFAALQAALSANNVQTAAAAAKFQQQNPAKIVASHLYGGLSEGVPISSQLAMTKQSTISFSHVTPGQLQNMACLPGQTQGQINNAAIAAAAARASLASQLLKAHQTLGPVAAASAAGGASSQAEVLAGLSASNIAAHHAAALRGGTCFCASCYLQKVSFSSLAFVFSSK